MTPKMLHKRAWALARRQHGVITRAQLLALGFTDEAIKHRLREARLHPVWRGVYAVGRPELTREGTWMAATLTCNGALSHSSAAALWQLRPQTGGSIEMTVAPERRVRARGVVVHRRKAEVTTRKGIPVTSLVQTFVDISTRLTADDLEAAINEADLRGLTNPERLRRALNGRRGAKRLSTLLDRRTFVLTRSRLERLFIPIARQTGLPKPETRAWVNGYEVDFYWPELGLVVETDGLRYHRTPAQQAADRRRDQTHTAEGLIPLRFTHAQVAYEREHVKATLAAVTARLG
jgi:very-short-patch-repair endonuclease